MSNKNKLIAIMNTGAISGLIFIVFDFISYYAGFAFSLFYRPLYFLGIILILVIGGRYLRTKINNGLASYGQMCWISLRLLFFTGVLFMFYRYIFTAFVAPDYLEQFFNATYETIEKSPISDEMKNDYIDMIAESKENSTPLTMAYQELFSMVIYGGVIALVTSAFLIKKDENPFNQAMSEIK